MLCSMTSITMPRNTLSGSKSTIMPSLDLPMWLTSSPASTTWLTGHRNNSKVILIYHIDLLNLQQKPPQERVSTADPLATRLGAPVSLDWRTSNIITSIKNQGSCGACYTFASIAQLEAMMVKSLGKSTDLNLAEQFVFECSSNYGCAGGYL